MTPEQEAKLMQDRIQELRFVLKRSPTNEEIQESIRQRPINYKNQGVTDLTKLTQVPDSTRTTLDALEEPGDAPQISLDPSDIMMLAQEVDAGEPNGLTAALNATRAEDSAPVMNRLPRDAKDVSGEGSEVMQFDYLSSPEFYYPIAPLKGNVGTGSLTFGSDDVITAETPEQKRDRINQTRKTVLSDPGFLEENVTAPRPVSEISDMSSVSENVDLLSKHGIPPEDVTETKEEVERKNIAQVIAENVAEVITPDSEKQVVEQAEDPVQLVQETIAKNEEIAEKQEKKKKEGVPTVEEGLVMPEEGVITSVDEVTPETAEIETQVVDGTPAVSMAQQTLKEKPKTSPTSKRVTLKDLMRSLDAGGLNKDIVNALLESPGYEMMFEKGVEKEKIDQINKEIRANNERLDKVAQKKIKPFFGEKDTGRKILAAIAAGMGAYASAMTGTKNFALEIINQAIETDLLKQKEQLERERLSILDQNKILESRKAELYTVAQIQIKDAMAKAADERDKQKLVVTLEGIEQKRKNAMISLGADIIKAETSREESLSNRYVPGFGTTAFTDETLVREAVKEAQKLGMNETIITEHSDGIRDVLKTTKGKTLAAIWYTPERQTLQYHLAEIANLYRQKILELGTQFTTFEGPFLEAIIKKDFNWRELAVGRIERMVDNLEKGINFKKKGIITNYRFSGEPTDSSQQNPQLNLSPGTQKASN